MADIFQADNGLPAFEHAGETIILGRLPTKPEVRGRFKAFAVEAAPTIPRSQWFALNRRDTLGDDFILNQKSYGSCVGYSSAGALMRARALAGQTFHKLSGSFVYSFINGGYDDGASIGDALGELQTHGACLDSEAPWDAIFPNRIPESAYDTAKRFRCDEGYRIETFDEAVTAILLGYVVIFPVMVGNTFDRLDSEDIVGLDRGNGNHAVGADGIYQSKMRGWCLDAFNSWDLTWGSRGRFRITQKHFESVDVDAYAIRVASLDPNDPLPKVSQ